MPTLPATSPDAYLTGTAALNIPDENGNFVDWHFDETFLKNGTRFWVAGLNFPSTRAVFGDYGIRECSKVLRQRGVSLPIGARFYAASYVRAVLDLVFTLTREHKPADCISLEDLAATDRDEVMRQVEALKIKITDRLQLTLLDQWMHQTSVSMRHE